MLLVENIFWLFKEYLLSFNFLRYSMLLWGRYNIILKYVFVFYDVENVSK